MEEGRWDVVVSISRGLWVVNEDVLRERNLLKDTEMDFFKC